MGLKKRVVGLIIPIAVSLNTINLNLQSNTPYNIQSSNGILLSQKVCCNYTIVTDISKGCRIGAVLAPSRPAKQQNTIDSVSE